MSSRYFEPFDVDSGGDWSPETPQMMHLVEFPLPSSALHLVEYCLIEMLDDEGVSFRYFGWAQVKNSIQVSLSKQLKLDSKTVALLTGQIAETAKDKNWLISRTAGKGGKARHFWMVGPHFLGDDYVLEIAPTIDHSTFI